jgi:hypothetical protein
LLLLLNFACAARHFEIFYGRKLTDWLQKNGIGSTKVPFMIEMMLRGSFLGVP